jgi:hypothetical protein|tara:strand:- start:67 stop:1902 length:1836 start_codon:yes stop_codon:yes gene_type:complete
MSKTENEKKIAVRFAGNEIVYLPESIANSNDNDLIKSSAIAERQKLGLPLSLQETQKTVETINPLLYGMEGVTGFNRPMASLLDIATSPIQYGIQAVRQGTINPQGGDFFKSGVPERGAFAGDDSLTKIIAGAGELTSMAMPSGVFTRAMANTLSQATRLSPNAFQRVLQEIGKTTPKQDVGFGFVSGAGGEAAVEASRAVGLEENEITRFAGQMLSPAALNVVAGKLINVAKNNIFKTSSPTLDDLRGLRTGLYATLDQAGIKQDGPSIKPFIASIDELMKKYTLDASGESVPRGILQGLKKQAEDGELTFSRIYEETKRLRSLDDSVSYNIAKALDEQLFNFKAIDEGVLKGQTFEEAFKAAKEAARREINANNMDTILQNLAIEDIAGSNYVNVLKSKLKPLVQKGQPQYNFLKPSERQIITDAIKGKGLNKILNAFSQVGFSSDDLIRSIFYTTLIGAVTGGVATQAGGSLALGGTIAAATFLGRGLGNAATNIVKKNAKLMESVLKAGPDGQRILEGYLKYTPKENRDPRDLAILFTNQKVDLRAIEDVATKSNSVFLKDSVGLAIGLDNVIKKEQSSTTPVAGETNIAGVTRPIPNRPDASFTVQ